MNSQQNRSLIALKWLPVLLAIVYVLPPAVWLYMESCLPDVRNLMNLTPVGSLQILDRSGDLIYSVNAPHEIVKRFSGLPKRLRQAVIASEDRRFLEHSGVDPQAILRAMKNNSLHMNFVEGGSTISQQVARIMFLNREKNLLRKLNEALLAIKIESTFSKEDILLTYLNHVYFGHGAWGIADASKLYFSKPVRELNTTEIATLIALLPNPKLYSPINNLHASQVQREVVLQKMLSEGKISKFEFNRSAHSTLHYNTSPESLNLESSQYFIDYIRKDLPISLDGLIVYSTLDADAQSTAYRTLQNSLRAKPSIKQGALFSLNPANGEILAMVGGVGKNDRFNRVVDARRQPGSAFKLFVYLAALKSGYQPDQLVDDSPVPGKYRPKSAHVGQMPLWLAFATSNNTVAVRIQNEVGIEKVIKMARRLGIESELRPVPSLALGSSETKLFEMVRAFGVIANNGAQVEPFAVRRIVDARGQTLFRAAAKPTEQLIDREVAEKMNILLSRVVKYGTGMPTHVCFPAAGKTGTTDGGRDLWFIGYVPNVITGVWLGNDQNAPTRYTSALAAQIWGRYMKKLPNRPDCESGQPAPFSSQGYQATKTPQSSEVGNAKEPSNQTHAKSVRKRKKKPAADMDFAPLW